MTSTAKETLYFGDFPEGGGGPDPCSHSGSAHDTLALNSTKAAGK